MRVLTILPATILVAAFAACGSENGGEKTPGVSADRLGTASATGKVQTVPQTSNPYTLFETLQTRPLALSPDGRLLFACNTPDNRLEIFRVDGKTLHALGSVVVGLEPVAVAARTPGEVWVVNHLSDSVSVVKVDDAGNATVAQTLLVGDEPRDIVFAGPGGSRAFVTTAHRGQNSPDDPDLFTPGVGRADVWVFDANNLGSAPGGTRLTKLTFFADTPRALAVTPDGKTVYAAAFFSGNQTTAVSDTAVSTAYGNYPQIPGGGAGPLVQLGPSTYAPEPNTGLVVKYTNGHWLDAYGTNFDAAVTITLPDQDVFAIDATANPPVAKASGVYAHVGTTLFNMAVNPRNGKVYVSNTDAHNDVRFEGHTPGFTSVAGNIVDSRISIIDPASGAITYDNLNPHLTHALPPAIVGTGDPTLSRAFPQDLTFSADGKTVYVVAQGSAKLAIYDTASLEAGTATPTQQNQVNLSAGGPTGVVTNGTLAYVLTRFDDGISIVDLGKGAEISHTTMFNPEPASVTAGRKFLYSAKDTSALGDQACASCHVGGDFDGLAWDLGNPSTIPLPITPVEYAEAQAILTASAQANNGIPTPAAQAQADQVLQNVFAFTAFEVPESFSFTPQQVQFIMGLYMPTKGPMTTQSLRGLDNHGAMHWRGDRNGAVQQTGTPFLDGNNNPVASAQPNSGIFDEFNAFKSFNVAFPGLVADAQQLSDADMSSYATFALQITYPPNPIRNLDDSLTDVQKLGDQVYHQTKNDGSGDELPIDRIHNCNTCHVLDRNGNAGETPHPGFFGTNGRLSFEAESQSFKVPHLRNAYQKVGMYGASVSPGHSLLSVPPFADPTRPVPAVRGFGYNHDGIEGSIEEFLASVVFIQSTVGFTFGPLSLSANPGGIPFFTDPSNPLTPDPTLPNPLSQQGIAIRRGLASYILAFDTNMFPIVGQEVTWTQANASNAAARIGLLESEAALGHCDLVAHGTYQGADHGATFSGGKWTTDVSGVAPLTDAQLEALAAQSGATLTFLAVPPGEGWRVGVDRDGDGYVDGDEKAHGTDWRDPRSHP